MVLRDICSAGYLFASSKVKTGNLTIICSIDFIMHCLPRTRVRSYRSARVCLFTLRGLNACVRVHACLRMYLLVYALYSVGQVHMEN